GSAAYTGMVNGDSLTFSAATAVFNDKNAGSKTVSVNGIVLGGADAGNYTLGNATASGSGTITAKTLTLSSIADKVYDGSSKASFSQGVLNGLVGSEVLDISGSGSYADKNAGIGKAFTVNAATLADAGSGASAGMASNYVLATPSGVTGTVSKASINGVTGIVANNKVYDGNALASLNTGSASFAGMVGGDNLAVTGASGS
ncbi:MAG: YDG domain-containing protein, partial [Janthinobacterium sp.]